MAGKEVLLSIDVDGIVQACLSINSRYAVDGDTTRSNKVNDFMILNDILRDNLKIENGLSDEEKQDAVDIVMNRICEYFLYNNYGMSAILGLYFALVSGKNELIRSRAIALVNNITKPNTFIYSPIYGIHRKGGAVEDINPNGDLKPIVCTLEIGGTHFSNLKETLHATSESLARQNASYLSEERQILNIFNVFSSQKEYYTLYELYNCIHN
ncbi:hypothetical protein NEMIN01_2380, partial [Nematocida minor]|uniref:uncharacterized protein n=1 Tax=Nematocida minor TaxID=1912983 RepID=UPI002220B51A